MHDQPSRRTFIVHSAGTVAATSLLPAAVLAVSDSDPAAPSGAGGSSVYGAFPSTDPELVRQVVGSSHANLDRLTPLIEKQPELAKSSIDWGFGDWECALGAASHMGRRDIAELLMDNGARPTHFTFAMLGQVDVVRAYVRASPGIQRVRGPHGITLLAHARRGREQAASVVEYLESLGDADLTYTNEPLSDAQQEALLGTYSFGASEEDRFEVATNRRGQLNIKRTTASFGRRLFHQGGLEFHPAGAEHARIAFTGEGATVSQLTLDMAGQTIVARRV